MKLTSSTSIFIEDYGFQPIEQIEEEGQHPKSATDLSDWKSSITGGLDI